MRDKHPKSLVVAGCVVAMLIAAPLRSWADGPRAGFWLATSTYGSGENGNYWGRLVIKGGVLTYHGAVREWHTPLADIKRVSPVKDSTHLFEIETISGSVLRLSVVGPQLVTEPSKKAIQQIQRAVAHVSADSGPVR